jgi:hypothetical protein
LSGIYGNPIEQVGHDVYSSGPGVPVDNEFILAPHHADVDLPTRPHSRTPTLFKGPQLFASLRLGQRVGLEYNKHTLCTR